MYNVALVHGADPGQVHGQNRARLGVKLYVTSQAEKVIVAGKREADGLAQIVMDGGVPQSDIIQESGSLTTVQGLWNARKICEGLQGQHGPVQLYLISQEWHADRLCDDAEQLVKMKWQFRAAVDGRPEEEWMADAAMEKWKHWADRISLLAPGYSGVWLNVLAYKAMAAVKR